jgi:hypothetical protein
MDQSIDADAEQQGSPNAGPPPYHPPLLRMHGGLRDLTMKSTDIQKKPE